MICVLNKHSSPYRNRLDQPYANYLKQHDIPVSEYPSMIMVEAST